MKWIALPRFWLLDYDLTLYGSDEAAVLDSLDRRITAFVARRLNLQPARADDLRREYCALYGTTLAGLMRNHGVSPGEYFDAIHGGEGLILPGPAPRRRAWLSLMPGSKVIFTNARRDWVNMGLESMGLSGCVDQILDIEFLGWRCKPDPQVYLAAERALGARGVEIVLVDDKEANLAPARELGWQTIWIHPDAGRVADKPWNGAFHDIAEIPCPVIA